jgi:hypothetical protein
MNPVRWSSERRQPSDAARPRRTTHAFASWRPQVERLEDRVAPASGGTDLPSPSFDLVSETTQADPPPAMIAASETAATSSTQETETVTASVPSELLPFGELPDSLATHLARHRQSRLWPPLPALIQAGLAYPVPAPQKSNFWDTRGVASEEAAETPVPDWVADIHSAYWQEESSPPVEQNHEQNQAPPAEPRSEPVPPSENRPPSPEPPPQPPEREMLATVNDEPTFSRLSVRRTRLEADAPRAEQLAWEFKVPPSSRTREDVLAEVLQRREAGYPVLAVLILGWEALTDRRLKDKRRWHVSRCVKPRRESASLGGPRQRTGPAEAGTGPRAPPG